MPVFVKKIVLCISTIAKEYSFKLMLRLGLDYFNFQKLNKMLKRKGLLYSNIIMHYFLENI